MRTPRSNTLLVGIIVGGVALLGWLLLNGASDGPAGVQVRPIVGGVALEVNRGGCAVPAADGNPPAGCEVQPESSPREISSPPGRLPLEIVTGVLSLTVASGPQPDAVQLVPLGNSRWELAFPDAPPGTYRVLLTTEVAQVSEFSLVVTAFAPQDERGQSNIPPEGDTTP